MADKFGCYQLLKPLGAGSVAEVYIAQTVDSPDKRLSLKRLHREHVHDPRIVAAFLAEAKLTTNLVHPNLVRVIDFGQIGDDYFITAEYVDGVDLAALRAAGRLSAATILQIAIDVCAGVDHVHQHAHVVHGDLSPRNILVGTDGVTRITDFGVAVAIDATDQPVRGTYAYMSPEQAHGNPMDARSDVFAIGVLVWEMIQHKRLFRRAEPFLSLTAVVDDEAPVLDIAELNAIVQRALKKQRSDRYASGEKFATALADAWAQLGVTPDRHEVTIQATAAHANDSRR